LSSLTLGTPSQPSSSDGCGYKWLGPRLEVVDRRLVNAFVSAGFVLDLRRGLAAGVGARGRVALHRLGQRGSLERRSVEDVALADLDLREAEMPHGL
jgi:hypothetical protein